MTTELDDVQQLNEKLLAKRRLAASVQSQPAPRIGQVICLPSACEPKQQEQAVAERCANHGCELREFQGSRYCPACVDEAREREYRQIAEEERLSEARRKQAEISKRFAAVQVGRRFQGQRWEDYQATCPQAERVKASCQEIAREFARHLQRGTNWLFVGRCGTGKNMLSALIAQDVVAAGHTALHTTAAKLVRRIRSSWGGHGCEEGVIEQFVGPDLLIIDEVGVQAGSDTEQRLLTEVINDRYEAMRPTICLSNHTVKELEHYLGERAMDRFCEGESRVLVFDWDSYRRRGGRQ